MARSPSPASRLSIGSYSGTQEVAIAPQAQEHISRNERDVIETDQIIFGDGTINAGPVASESSAGAWFCFASCFRASSKGVDWAKDQVLEHGSTGVLWPVCGFFGAIMIAIIPFWDGISLLHDPVWEYLYGRSLSITLILTAVATPLLFVIAQSCLHWGCRRRTARHEQNLFQGAMLFVLLYGAILVSLSTSINRRALLGELEFSERCGKNEFTKSLDTSYQSLQKLRSNSKCASLFSVEECSGFQETPENHVLKGLEESLQCSGFCFVPAAASDSSKQTSSTTGYPPALFSRARTRGSCSAMAARNMEGFVKDIGKQLLWEGYFLVGAFILQAFMMLTKLCGVERRKYIKDEPQDQETYGTMPFQTANVVGPPHHVTMNYGPNYGHHLHSVSHMSMRPPMPPTSMHPMPSMGPIGSAAATAVPNGPPVALPSTGPDFRH